MEEVSGIPGSWSQVMLADLFLDPKSQIVDGPFGSNLKASEYKSAGIPVLRIQNIERNKFVDKNINFITDEKAEFLKRHSFLSGDIIITKLGAPVGKACFVPKKYEKGIIVADLIRARITHNYVDPKFLVYQINSIGLIKQFEKFTKGTTRPRINLGIVRQLKFNLPSLKEQHRIVAKIEELFSELDNGVENLKLAQNQLKVYRQAMLKHAFEGKLTEEWRKENNPEPAEKLLERIKEERQARYEQELKDWKEAVKNWEKEGKRGKRPGKPRKMKDLGEFSSSDIKDFPSLPAQWSWAKIDQLSEYGQYSIKAGPFGSSLKKEFYTKSGYKIYGQEQVISGNAHYGDYYVGQEKYDELISCSIKPQDVLISLVGTVGKVLVLPENCEKGIINPRLIKLSLDQEHYLPFMFKYYFESYFLKSLYSTHTHGATMDVLNLSIIQGLPFPFMSLQEQDQIVSEIESQFSIIDKLEAEIRFRLQNSEVLRQSILKTAFEGKLVNQDPNDESASELINRIQEEKKKYLEEQKQQKKKAPKKPKKMSKELSIEEVLKASKKPMLAKDVWQQSRHKDNIEEFYAELKKIQDKVKEVKKGTESLLSLAE